MVLCPACMHPSFILYPVPTVISAIQKTAAPPSFLRTPVRYAVPVVHCPAVLQRR
eukprot:COSAG05_NODE_2853_length_2570_cov_2.961149_2_plen_55_part_00